jgi:catalytic LigB subunit of aromatic ring-opening dioxygenase
MAKIVYGAGASHTPVLALPPEHWEQRALADYRNEALTLSNGATLSYEALLKLTGGKYAGETAIERFREKAAACQCHLDRLADELEAAAADVVVIVGDDQEELFGLDNTPLISIYYGEELVMHSEGGHDERDDWERTMLERYAMDEFHRFPGRPDLALSLIRGLLDRGVDIAAAANVRDPATAGFGHAYGFIIQRLFKGRRIPVVPVLLNTYYPPNVPSASRCFDIGQHLRAAIEAAEPDLRIALIASGGLSHFVVDEQLDHDFLQALRGRDVAALRGVPREALRSGSSEILNWIVAAGALHLMPLDWSEYVPVYRSAAGTGVGCGFAAWKTS